MELGSVGELIAAAYALGAASVPGLSVPEKELESQGTDVPDGFDTFAGRIRAGEDPLGDAFCRLRTAEERRPRGQTYTPASIVNAMIGWTETQPTPARVVDPGVGSGRFLLAAAAAYPDAELVGVDIDPLAALMARANLAAAGHATRSRVELLDYRQLPVGSTLGPTLYVGNPPYVRHHDIAPEWKRWLSDTAARRGLKASQLAGLHVHFFLATLEHAQPGDYGVFVTSSEWLDVNYGALLRALLLDGLGGNSVHAIDPTAAPFADATSTAAITSFRIGQPVESIRLQSAKTVAALGNHLSAGHNVTRDRLLEASRWSPLLRATPKTPDGYVELGELARVHRGTVTGANKVWVTRRSATRLPDEVLRPAVTKAKELFAAGSELVDASGLRVVIDLPVDLDELDDVTRRRVNTFLRRPEVRQTRTGYVASNRKAWWSVGLRTPAPILATYMARRPPAFVRNTADARHINIAHGIYPRETMTPDALAKLSEYLRVSVTLGQGRTYAGGLTKFEPREMERLPVPTLELLNDANYTPEMGHAATVR